MNVLLISLGFGMMTAAGVIPLIKKRDIRGITIYAVLIAMGYTLSLVQVLGLKIPSPTDLIELAVRTFVHMKFSFSQ